MLAMLILPKMSRASGLVIALHLPKLRRTIDAHRPLQQCFVIILAISDKEQKEIFLTPFTLGFRSRQRKYLVE
jgi:hypothetical protein